MKLFRYGSRGIEVSALQWSFNEMVLSLASLHIDGIFGPLTLNAVRSFQNAAQLTVDGVVGPKTWGAIARQFDGANGQSGHGVGPSAKPGAPPMRLFVPAPHRAAEARLLAMPRSAPQPLAGGAPAGHALLLPVSQTARGSAAPAALSPSPKKPRSIVDPFGLGKDVTGKDIIGAIYFETNEVELDGNDISELRKLRAYEPVLENRSIVFECQGVADPRGTKGGNTIISRQRAEAVAKKIPTLLAPTVRKNAQTAVIALGPAIGPAIDNPFQRVCFILAPPLPRATGKKKTPVPDLRRRILRATLAILADVRSEVEANRLLCMLGKIETGHALSRNLRTLNDKNYGFFSKTQTTPDFRTNMHRGLFRGKVTPTEDANWWVFVADFLESPAFGDTKTNKQMRDALHGMHDELVLAMKIPFEEVAAAGGASTSRTPNLALNQVHALLRDLIINRQESVYSCWKNVLRF